MRTCALVFPHQLFSAHPALGKDCEKVFLVEDTLFFHDKTYPMRMHKQKLAYHRETMQLFAAQLSKRFDVESVLWESKTQSLNALCKRIAAEGFERVSLCDVHDFSLQQRLKKACVKHALELSWQDTPMFLNTREENTEYRSGKKRWFMKDFYQWQRRRLDVLMEDDEPLGGQWSFDEDNRKKLPKKLIPDLPLLPTVRASAERANAVAFVEKKFAQNPGKLATHHYPATHGVAAKWLDTFLEERFELFGPYEDAIVEKQNWLYHSVLTPMLNIGLLTPKQVIDKTLEAAVEYGTPIESVEGFVRQIIGWREFMRATYEDLGVAMRTTNHWNHTHPVPDAFYTATTGIDPIDDTIERILKTGYCHHIERLIVLGGFMFLCEIDPDEIYRWFMEMFIDSYDWVMVPNVYAMSQHADGGAITTKPYFSGSNYVIRMSHYKKGDWSGIWDALFWRWILNNKKELATNPRWAMVCRNAERMDAARVKDIQATAEAFLKQITS